MRRYEPKKPCDSNQTKNQTKRNGWRGACCNCRFKIVATSIVFLTFIASMYGSTTHLQPTNSTKEPLASMRDGTNVERELLASVQDVSSAANTHNIKLSSTTTKLELLPEESRGTPRGRYHQTTANNDNIKLFNASEQQYFRNRSDEVGNVVLTFITSDHMDFLLNWISYSISRKSLRRPIAIVCLDAEAAERLHALQISCFRYRMKSPDLSSMGLRAGRGHARVEIITSLLEMGLHIVLTDCDALWQRNPMPVLRRIKGDIVSSRAQYPIVSTKRWGASLCMGFILFRATESSKIVLRETLNSFENSPSDSDQQELNHALMKFDLRWPVHLSVFGGTHVDMGYSSTLNLSVALLPHHFFMRKCPRGVTPLPTNVMVAHCNLEGVAFSKKEILRSHGLWILKDDMEWAGMEWARKFATTFTTTTTKTTSIKVKRKRPRPGGNQSADSKLKLPRIQPFNASGHKYFWSRSDDAGYVILLFVTSNHLPFLLNWITYASWDRALSHKVAIVCLDAESVGLLRSLRMSCFYYDTSNLLLFGLRAGRGHARVEVIIRLLDMGLHVLLSDCDALWRKNPMPILKEIDADIVSSRAQYPKEAYLRWGAALCMGFILFRSTENSKFLLRSMLSSFHDTATDSDQSELNRALIKFDLRFKSVLYPFEALDGESKLDMGVARKPTLSVGLLPHDLFMRKCPRTMSALPANVVVAHCNLEGPNSTKMGVLERHGLWVWNTSMEKTFAKVQDGARSP